MWGCAFSIFKKLDVSMSMSTDQNEWRKPPLKLALQKEEVHIWKASLTRSLPEIDLFRKQLSQDEIERAERYCFEKDRHHFIVSRGILRTLLSCYLECLPTEIHFSYNSFGKPSLVGDHLLEFNVSHSQELVVYAFSYGRSLGIDIEYCRPTRNIELISHSFSDVEQKQLSELPREQQLKGFYQCWTRKEAFIKAAGKGFALRLKSFDVSLDPTSSPKILRIDSPEEQVQDWSLQDIPVPEEYAGALVVKNWHWTPLYYQY